MSRSGYTYDCGGWDLIRWRGAVTAAIRGRRGQAILTEMLAALDAMPNKRLIRDELVSDTGEVCALGTIAKSRGLDVAGLDPYDREEVAKTFDIAPSLAAEIADVNDGGEWRHDTPEERWHRVRGWVAGAIVGASDARMPPQPILAPRSDDAQDSSSRGQKGNDE